MYPFSEIDSSRFFGALVEAIEQEIWALSNEYVVSKSPEEMEEEYVGC